MVFRTHAKIKENNKGLQEINNDSPSTMFFRTSEDYGKQPTMSSERAKIMENNNGTQHIREDYGKEATVVLITHVKITEQLKMVFRKHANTVASQRSKGFDSTRLDQVDHAVI